LKKCTVSLEAESGTVVSIKNAVPFEAPVPVPPEVAAALRKFEIISMICLIRKKNISLRNQI
jgi:hypothetical protein